MEFITYLNYAIGIQEVRQAVGLFIIISLVIVLPVYAFLVNIYRAKREARTVFTIHPSVVSALEYGNKVIKNTELEIEEQERIFKDFIRSGKKSDAENKGGFLIPKMIKKKRRGFLGWLFRLFKNDKGWEYVDLHKRLAINERVTNV